MDDVELFPAITPESLTEEMLTGLKTNLQTNEGSYTRDILSTAAVAFFDAYKTLNRIFSIAFVNKNSGQYLETRCEEYGITRKEGTPSSVVLEFAGQDAAVIPSGTTCGTAGGFLFSTTESVTVSGGTATANATAQEIGQAGNVPQNTIQNMVSPVSGVESVRNPAAAAGGSDTESDESLFDRLDLYRKRRATSGNIADYEQWALSVPGVGAAQVVPLWDGAGTVKVLLAGYDKKPVDDAIVSNCQKYIDGVRPIGAAVTVESAAAFPVNITAAVVLADGVVLDNVKAAFTQKAASYLQSLALEKNVVPYNRVAFLLLNVDSVENFTQFEINGAEEDLQIPTGAVPVLGEVVMT